MEIVSDLGVKVIVGVLVNNLVEVGVGVLVDMLTKVFVAV